MQYRIDWSSTCKGGRGKGQHQTASNECPSPGDLPNPGIEPGSPALQADALPSEPPGKPNKRERCSQWQTAGQIAWLSSSATSAIGQNHKTQVDTLKNWFELANNLTKKWICQQTRFSAFFLISIMFGNLVIGQPPPSTHIHTHTNCQNVIFKILKYYSHTDMD